MDRNQLQRALLAVVGDPAEDHRLGGFLIDAVKKKLNISSLPRSEFWLAAWSLVAQGLSYIDMDQSASENWSLELSPSGRALLKDEEANPDDPAGFMKSISDGIPRLSPIAKRYIAESIDAYTNRLYMASAVMLGVASEVVVYETAQSLAQALGASGDKFNAEIEGKGPFVKKVEAFEKRLSTEIGRLPAELVNDLQPVLFGVLSLFRNYRNDAGHAKSLNISRDVCGIHLRLATTYFQRLYLLQATFETWKK